MCVASTITKDYKIYQVPINSFSIVKVELNSCVVSCKQTRTGKSVFDKKFFLCIQQTLWAVTPSQNYESYLSSHIFLLVGKCHRRGDRTNDLEIISPHHYLRFSAADPIRSDATWHYYDSVDNGIVPWLPPLISSSTRCHFFPYFA